MSVRDHRVGGIVAVFRRAEVTFLVPQELWRPKLDAQVSDSRWESGRLVFVSVGHAKQPLKRPEC